MLGLQTRSIILASETGDHRIVMGPWEVAVPGVALFLENNSEEDALVYIEGCQERQGYYIIGYGADSPISLSSGGRVVTTMDPLMSNDEVSVFIGFRLGTALTTGFVRINVVGFAPLPECQMATPLVGTAKVWWH
jgi:hypothetical protein